MQNSTTNADAHLLRLFLAVQANPVNLRFGRFVVMKSLPCASVQTTGDGKFAGTLPCQRDVNNLSPSPVCQARQHHLLLCRVMAPPSSEQKSSPAMSSGASSASCPRPVTQPPASNPLPSRMRALQQETVQSIPTLHKRLHDSQDVIDDKCTTTSEPRQAGEGSPF